MSLDLKQTPEDLSLVPLLPVWTITVTEITPGSTSRQLLVDIAGFGTVYTWTELVQTTSPGFTATYAYDGTTLVVTLSTTSTQGQQYSFTTTYSDSTDIKTIYRTYLAGEPSVLTQSPPDMSADVSKSASVLFNLSTTTALPIVSVMMFINDNVAYDSPSGFIRPDFEGSALLTSKLLTMNVGWRRDFDEASRVMVSVMVGFQNSPGPVVYGTYEWEFYVARSRTPISNAVLQNTPVDVPAQRGIFEAFRAAGISSVRPAQSTASASVLLFYAVQHSGLSSLAPYLPGANLLAVETGNLRRGDILPPDQGYANLLDVVPFFEVFLRELVADGAALHEEAALLSRTWNSDTPTNRIAAVAAALLYAFPVPG